MLVLSVLLRQAIELGMYTIFLSSTSAFKGITCNM